MRAIIFVNGTVDDYTALDRALRPTDYLIAADGGARHCLAIGRTPHALIGDLDSVDAAIVTKLATQQVHIERYPRDKDKTDLELALDYALRIHTQIDSPSPNTFQPQGDNHFSEIILVGAMGDRLDQMLGNVLILAQRDWPVPVILEDNNVRAQVVRPHAPLVLSAAIGDTISALPLSDTVTGITYTGMRYPLENHTLRLGSTHGMSNVVVAEPATVRISFGRLLMIERLDQRNGA